MGVEDNKVEGCVVTRSLAHCFLTTFHMTQVVATVKHSSTKNKGITASAAMVPVASFVV